MQHSRKGDAMKKIIFISKGELENEQNSDYHTKKP